MMKGETRIAGIFAISVFLFSLTTFAACGQGAETYGYALIKRTIPKHAAKFKVEIIPPSSSGDVFEIESRGNKIVLRGNNGVSIASALYYYIKNVAGGQITWNGSNIRFPDPLPAVSSRIRKESPYDHRYYLNYCTFNYSMSWWNWDRWEKEIDWMAMHGINMPLAITGQEYVWYQVYKELGFSDADLKDFFSGPAYFGWFWMGNLDGWGGPLPQSWIERHKVLQQQIVRRQRELGMKPVLPAFTGHVPKAFARRYPKARLKATNWTNGFEDTYILDAEDPLFAEIGKKFLETQTKYYGTDHFYSADTFNENEPPSNEPEALAALSKKVYEGMRLADPQAVWVMQGWLFYSDREFWHAPQIKGLLSAVPDDRMIILDLATEIEPVWKRTEAFYGKPWIWNMLHNFGGNVSLFGRMDIVAREPALARVDSLSGNMRGIGLTMEAIEQNPVLYELMTDHTWRHEPVALESWLKAYVRQRYGVMDSSALAAWGVLHQTVYNGQAIRDGAESIMVARPTLASERRWAKTKLNYLPADLLPAWHHMVAAAGSCKGSEGFQYDLVDLTRQVLANYALVLHHDFVEAYRNKNREAFEKSSHEFLTLMDDLDALLATRSEFLLGKWIADARAWGSTASEKRLYERNARDLITLWGGEDNRLHEYSCRQWNGLIADFYKPRWEQFFRELTQSLKENKELNQEAFDVSCRKWEWQWVNTEKSFAAAVQGDPVEKARQLFDKYNRVIGAAYASNGR